jgi:hypothetical protein
MRFRNCIYMAMNGFVSLVGACTFGRFQTKSSGTSTGAANFNGQRNTLCRLNLWQNCIRGSSAYYATVVWAQWRRRVRQRPPQLGCRWSCVSGDPQMFRLSVFHVGSYGLDSFPQYYERFWSNFAFNWCGGRRRRRLSVSAPLCAVSTCCVTVMRATLQQSVIYFYWLWQICYSVGLYWSFDFGSFSSIFICWLWCERHTCMLVRSYRTELKRGST